jgi:LysM repeat protein
VKTRIMVAIVLVALLLPLVAAPAAGAAGGVWYTVRWGDTLYRIARQHGVTVNAIVQANGLANPNYIRSGQRLLIPTGSGPSTGPGCSYQVHTVQRGDTLYAISRRYGVTVWAIVQANGLASPNLIFAGQKLIIPSGSVITIVSPAAGAVLHNSVHVTGQGRAFENQLTVEVRTATGVVLASTTAMIDATSMDRIGPYAADLTWTAPATQQAGTIVVYDASAADGSVNAQACVSVILQPSFHGSRFTHHDPVSSPPASRCAYTSRARPPPWSGPTSPRSSSCCMSRAARE